LAIRTSWSRQPPRPIGGLLYRDRQLHRDRSDRPSDRRGLVHHHRVAERERKLQPSGAGLALVYDRKLSRRSSRGARPASAYGRRGRPERRCQRGRSGRVERAVRMRPALVAEGDGSSRGGLPRSVSTKTAMRRRSASPKMAARS
jgi:hypothetical protein